MRKILLFLVPALVLHLVSCNKAGQKDGALLAAEECYDSLLAGNYAYFIRHTQMPDTIPSSYREQLETNLKMFMARQQEEHRGIKAVSAVRSVHDTIASRDENAVVHTADVFVELTFGDSLKEEIVVPMIEKNSAWLMR